MYHLLYNPIDSDYYLIDTRTITTAGHWYERPPDRCFNRCNYASSLESTLAYFTRERPDWPLIVVASSPSPNFHTTHPELYL